MVEYTNNVDSRMGAQRVLNPDAVKNGWNILVRDIKSSYQSFKNSQSNQELIANFNRLAPLCLEVFDIGSAGRGTEPSRIGPESVLVSSTLYELDDKLFAGEKSARPLPHTSLTIAAIKIYWSAAEIAAKRLNLPTDHLGRSLFNEIVCEEITPNGPASPQYRWVPLQASHITEIAKKYFEDDLNFQRHVFVTTAGECLIERWHIRALTGHGTFLTSAFSLPMGVAPIEGVSGLRCDLESLYIKILGDTKSFIDIAKDLHFPECNHLPMHFKPSFEVSKKDSHSTLDCIPALDRQCLIDWKYVDSLRAHYAKYGTSSPATSVFISSLAHSGVSNLDVAIDFACNPAPALVGQRHGIAWRRAHYKHDIWLPLQDPTVVAISEQQQFGQVSRVHLIATAATFLRSMPGFFGWPEDDFQCLVRFSVACERWRRIELPPNMCALSSPVFETSCLSPLSLGRLANPESFPEGQIGQIAQTFLNSKIPHVRNHALSEITTAINTWAKDDSLGGQIARAQGLIKELNQLGEGKSSVFNFARDFALRECQAISDKEDKGKLSSLGTRWSALYPTLEELDLYTEPEDFGPSELIQFSEKVNEYCLNAMQSNEKDGDRRYVTGTGKDVSERAREALQRFFRNLSRAGWEVDDEVWESIGGSTVHYPRISASSTLVLPSNLNSIVSAACLAFAEKPNLALALESKVRTMWEFPQRVGEGSSLPINCLTDSGEILICKSPFATDKSMHAPRVWPISDKAYQTVQKFQVVQREINPGARWLYRFDERAIAEDRLINSELGKIIRHVTCDPHGRVHSIRAAAYQNILWPNWTSFAQLHFSGQSTASSCLNWIQSTPVSVRWTIAIRAAQAAGHGAVDPGLRSYAGGWPIIYSIYLCATLTKCQPTGLWARKIGVEPNTVDAAKSKSKNALFDRWAYLRSKASIENTGNFYIPVAKEDAKVGPLPEQASKDHPGKSGIDLVASIKFLSLISLEEPLNRALRDSNLPERFGTELQKYLPAKGLVDEARARLKSTSDGVALASDIALIKSDDTIVKWIASLDSKTAHAISCVLNRDSKGILGSEFSVRDADFWSSIVSLIPSSHCFFVRFGRGKHLPLPEENKLREIGPSLQLGDRHKDLGQMPAVMISLKDKFNYVDMRRRTAVSKLYLLMLNAVHEYQFDKARSNAQ